MGKQKISQLDLEELQAVLTGSDSEDTNEVENLLYDKYGIDSENFELLMNDLFNMLTLNFSPLTTNTYIGFGKDGVWTVKKDVTAEFIGSVIEFCLDGEEYNLEGRGYTRTITNGDIPEYELLITKPENNISVTKPIDFGRYDNAAEASGYLLRTGNFKNVDPNSFPDKIIISIANYIHKESNTPKSNS